MPSPANIARGFSCDNLITSRVSHWPRNSFQIPLAHCCVSGISPESWAGSPLIVLLGVALWGLHMGFTQGIFAAIIADVTPPEWKGTAFGLFNLASGVFVLLASLVAGGLWDGFGAAVTFYTGAALSLSALMMLALLYRNLR